LRRIAAAFLALLLAAGCRRSGPHDLKLEIRGAAGTRVTVDIDVDGLKSTVEGALPLDVQRLANRLEFDVRKLSGPEKELVRVQVIADGTLRNSNAGDDGVEGVIELEAGGSSVIRSSTTGR